MTRAVSTVLDVAVALLLVSAAVGVLVAEGGGSNPTPDAAPAAETLATGTASLEYTLAPGARHGPADRFHRVGGPGFRRTAHGTLLEHLRDAATGNVTVSGTEVTRTDDGFTARVNRAVAQATARRTAVRATWSPYRGSPVAGAVRVGRGPPPDATTSSVTVAVDSGCPPAAGAARRAAESGGYEAVGRVVARAVVRCLFPVRPTRLALAGDYPVDELTRHRYRRFAGLTGTALGSTIGPRDVDRANARLHRALAARFAADMRARFETPAAAARTVDVDTVRVVVRRWA